LAFHSGREADHSPLVPRSKNGWNCTSTPPIRIHGVLRGSTGTLPLPLPLPVDAQGGGWEGNF
jgi:hypothetical protein